MCNQCREKERMARNAAKRAHRAKVRMAVLVLRVNAAQRKVNELTRLAGEMAASRKARAKGGYTI